MIRKGTLSVNMICPPSERSFWQGNGPIPKQSDGRKISCKFRSSITGGRPKHHGPSQAILWGWGFCRCYYQTGDAGYLDDDGYLYIMARTDDIINVAGHRLSTGQMEEVVSEHRDVAECAVLGIADEMKGQIPAGFVVLNAGVNRDFTEIDAELVKLVRERIGPVAAFKTVLSIPRLPKTRSGKILRGTIQKIADQQEFKVPATIDDPAILDEIKQALVDKGMLD